MKITDRLRNEAALVCAACASHGEPISITKATALLYGVPETLAVRSQVARVAVRAWDAAHRALDRATERITDEASLREDYAEAEALLRTGFVPEGWTP